MLLTFTLSITLPLRKKTDFLKWCKQYTFMTWVIATIFPLQASLPSKEKKKTLLSLGDINMHGGKMDRVNSHLDCESSPGQTQGQGRKQYPPAPSQSLWFSPLPLLWPPFPRCFHTHSNLQSLEDPVFRYVIVSPALPKYSAQIPYKPGTEDDAKLAPLIYTLCIGAKRNIEAGCDSVDDDDDDDEEDCFANSDKCFTDLHEWMPKETVKDGICSVMSDRWNCTV